VTLRDDNFRVWVGWQRLHLVIVRQSADEDEDERERYSVRRQLDGRKSMSGAPYPQGERRAS
jgi:hypothetical protein